MVKLPERVPLIRIAATLHGAMPAQRQRTRHRK
jgi:hypothetical protein